ncbi:MAG: DUF2334 domain-containing protein [Candidatus Omnitrophica bacterium]|nr:DUF2334 domain-containing protein [Candidatus Omnitrophota bacterium]
MKEKIYTLKYILNGLYESEREIGEFLKVFRFSLDFISPVSPWRLLYNLRRYKTLQMSHLLRYIFNIRDKFCQFKGINEKEGNPLFLIRVDDFPHWEKSLDDFKRFHGLMEEFETPYLLGVTPYLSLDRHNPFNDRFKLLEDKEVEIIKHPLIDIAMHGFSHQTNNPKKNQEFVGLKEREREEKVEKGLKIFRRFDINPFAFIPPFDRIDMRSYKVLSQYFKIITGGPESTRYLGYKVTPSFFKGTLYIPSYRPLSSYQRCIGLTKTIQEYDIMSIRRPVILSLVIHWARETKDGYNSLEELLKIVKGKVIYWKKLLSF